MDGLTIATRRGLGFLKENGNLGAVVTLLPDAEALGCVEPNNGKGPRINRDDYRDRLFRVSTLIFRSARRRGPVVLMTYERRANGRSLNSLLPILSAADAEHMNLIWHRIALTSCGQNMPGSAATLGRAIGRPTFLNIMAFGVNLGTSPSGLPEVIVAPETKSYDDVPFDAARLALEWAYSFWGTLCDPFAKGMIAATAPIVGFKPVLAICPTDEARQAVELLTTDAAQRGLKARMADGYTPSPAAPVKG